METAWSRCMNAEHMDGGGIVPSRQPTVRRTRLGTVTGGRAIGRGMDGGMCGCPRTWFVDDRQAPQKAGALRGVGSPEGDRPIRELAQDGKAIRLCAMWNLREDRWPGGQAAASCGRGWLGLAAPVKRHRGDIVRAELHVPSQGERNHEACGCVGSGCVDGGVDPFGVRNRPRWGMAWGWMVSSPP